MSTLTLESLRRKNFEPKDFFVSETAKKLGLKNYPRSGEELAILTALMSTADLMQEIRDILNKPVFINSAYRSLLVNRALKSKDSSQHILGLACDFTCPSFGSPEDIVSFLKSKGVIVDQCFNEGTWVHVSRLLPRSVSGRNPNRMMYAHYLLDQKTNKRVMKLI